MEERILGRTVSDAQSESCDNCRVPRLGCVVLFLMVVLPAASQAPPRKPTASGSTPEPAIPAILAAFDRYEVVAMPEGHGMKDVDDLILSLIRDPFSRKGKRHRSRITNAKSTLDTYPAIAYALSQLQERHSSLDLPDSLPAKQKETIRAQMKKVAGTSRPPLDRSPFATRKEIEGHIDHLDGMSFAHLVVPMCVGRYTDEEKNAAEFQQFADKLHRLTVDLQAQKPDSWIIDLRGNLGGNMWPMLAGIGLVVGEGDLGSFQSPDGNNESWYYRTGKAGSRSHGQDSVGAQVTNPPFQLPQLPWVAVLLDRSTASSGEAIAISFAGRPRSRSFGERTMGFATANEENPLSDGATLYLCSSVEA